MSTARFARRLFSQVAASSRASRQSSAPWTGMAMRRGMASTHGAKEAARNDTPWLIGAGTITAVGTFYLLTPPSKKSAHKVAVSGHPVETAHQPASSEGAAVRGEKFTGTKAAELKSTEPMKDDEGTEVSGEEIANSSAQAYDADAPKDAKAAEEDGSSTRFDDGAPGQTSAVHDEGDKPEIREKPSKQAGKEDGEGGPTDLGEARKSAKEHEAPKQAAESGSGEKSD